MVGLKFPLKRIICETSITSRLFMVAAPQPDFHDLYTVLLVFQRCPSACVR
jgi:hypothetical protein